MDAEARGHQARTAAASDAGSGLERATQHRLRDARLPGHEVETPVHAVCEIDVGMPRRAEHNLGAWSPASTFRVGGQVVRAEVGLDLDEPAPHYLPVELANEDLAQQVARHDNRVSFEERSVEDGVALSRWEFWPEFRQASSWRRAVAACRARS